MNNDDWNNVINLLIGMHRDCVVVYPSESSIEELLPEVMRRAPAHVKKPLQALCNKLKDKHRFLKAPDSRVRDTTGRERWVRGMLELDNLESLDFMFARQEELRARSIKRLVKDRPNCIGVEEAVTNEGWQNRPHQQTVPRTGEGIFPFIGGLLAHSKQVKVYDYVLGRLLIEDYLGDRSKRLQSPRFLDTITEMVRHWLSKSWVLKREFEIVTEFPLSITKDGTRLDVEKHMRANGLIGPSRWDDFLGQCVAYCHDSWLKELTRMVDDRELHLRLCGHEKLPRNRYLQTERAMVWVGKGFDFMACKPQDTDSLSLCTEEGKNTVLSQIAHSKRLVHIDLI